MANTLTPLPKLRFTDNNGNPLVNGLVFTYSAGSTSKIATTVSSSGANNANPIVLDYRGECDCWLTPNTAYKFTLAPAGDTDPPTKPIWTVDNIINAQLLTLFGGVDTGIANAYILNFAAPFSSYVDGTVIYWIPSHSNTGPSTINVNGLGAVPIVNQDGSALYLGQLQANQFSTIVFKSGSFLLISTSLLPKVNLQNANYQFAITDQNNIVLHTDAVVRTYTIPADATVTYPTGSSLTVINQGNANVVVQGAVGVNVYVFGTTTVAAASALILSPSMSSVFIKTAANTWEQMTQTSVISDSGAFVGTLTGMTGATTGVISWRRVGNLVMLQVQSVDIVGTSNTTALTMTGLTAALFPTFQTMVSSFPMIDNSVNKGGWATIGTAGTITFGIGIDGNAAGFTAAGNKGLRAGWNVIYTL